MTEPDLVTIGDCASIDNASLIAHINTRGVWMLRHLNVGSWVQCFFHLYSMHSPTIQMLSCSLLSYCVLKRGCRLLSGASMEDHSILLEHTLALAGETVEEGKVWQGWPSSRKLSLEDYRHDVQRALTFAYFSRSNTMQTKSPSFSDSTEDSRSDLPVSYVVPLLEDTDIFWKDDKKLVYQKFQIVCLLGMWSRLRRQICLLGIQ